MPAGWMMAKDVYKTKARRVEASIGGGTTRMTLEMQIAVEA
jgi:hypothetical protein